MKTWIVWFTKAYDIQIEVKAEDFKEAEEKAQQQFNEINDPLEVAQEGYWEIVDSQIK